MVKTTKNGHKRQKMTKRSELPETTGKGLRMTKMAKKKLKRAKLAKMKGQGLYGGKSMGKANEDNSLAFSEEKG